MKKHLRIIDRTATHAAEFRVACGCMAANWTRDTTSDMGAVTCGRCRRRAHDLWESGKATLEPVWLAKKDGTRELIREELVLKAKEPLTRKLMKQRNRSALNVNIQP